MCEKHEIRQLKSLYIKVVELRKSTYLYRDLDDFVNFYGELKLYFKLKCTNFELKDKVINLPEISTDRKGLNFKRAILLVLFPPIIIFWIFQSIKETREIKIQLNKIESDLNLILIDFKYPRCK